MIQLYNTKTSKIEEFKSIKENEVSMYVCGPTVYNHAHIGNARPIITFDTLRRLFEAEGYKVKYVSNFTDVDDKIIKKAHDEGVDETVIAQRYIDAYQMVRSALHTETLDATPRVTETMDEIVAFIDELVKKGFAYEIQGDVYFRVNAVDTYGEISKQNIEDLKVGARIEENSKKESPLDFALWKKTDMGIKWKSPWGEGRPGWHTECVVMIGKEFEGQQIDIHGGGMDLKFPHHENEVAQSRALHHHPIAHTWMHNAMVNIDGEKMSKSLGNVAWAKDVIEALGADLVRWLMLSVHYRGELSFSDATIDAARTELTKVQTALRQARIKAQTRGVSLHNEKNLEAWNAFLNAMNDDLNTPNAYGVIYETVKLLNQSLRVKEIQWDILAGYVNSIEAMLQVLGVECEKILLSKDDVQLFEQWNEAKANKDFELADQFRKDLISRGLI